MTLQFKIQLRGLSKPTVWRRIVIPATFTFHQLHQTIQEAFGWYDAHLYQFQHHPYDGGWSFMDPKREPSEDASDARNTVVNAFITMRSLKKFVYVYDFGDDWIHDITLEKVDNDAQLNHPVCLAGKGACPPEDCRGIYGYEEMKEVFATRPKSKEANEYRDWLFMEKNENLDPNAFDIEEINYNLERLPDDYDEDFLFDHPGDDDSDNADDDDYEDDFPEYEEHTEDEKLSFFDDLIDELAIRPGKTTLVKVLAKAKKAEIIEQAEKLNIRLNKRLGEENIRKQLAEKILADPVALLRQLPLQDLRILETLLDEPDEANLVDIYYDFCKPIMVYYDIFGEWFDIKNLDYYAQIPDDLWQALKPHVKEVLKEEDTRMRIGVEAFIEGLCNLYGQVTRGFAKKELVRSGTVLSLEEADSVLDVLTEQSVYLKFIEFYGDEYDEQGNDGMLYLSRYDWDMPDELGERIAKHKEIKTREFSEMETVVASRNPCPIIPNSQKNTFETFLKKKLHLNEWEVTETCHRLWYYHNQQDNDFEEHPTPGKYFVDSILNKCDKMNKKLFVEALKQLDLYLDNMPHWQLKGNTPAETGLLQSKNADDKELLKLADNPHTPLQLPLEPEYDYDPAGWLNPTMPIVLPKTPGRNDPCPCGSGKKYKHCCGRGN